MKEGDGAPGHHPFNRCGGEQRKGARWWKTVMQQEGGREREREKNKATGAGVSPRPMGGTQPAAA
jgi:hypothetical protein